MNKQKWLVLGVTLALIASGAISFDPLAASNGESQTVNWTYNPAAADLDVPVRVRYAAVPEFLKKPWSYNGEHYWNIGNKGYPVRLIAAHIGSRCGVCRR